MTHAHNSVVVSNLSDISSDSDSEVGEIADDLGKVKITEGQETAKEKKDVSSNGVTSNRTKKGPTSNGVKKGSYPQKTPSGDRIKGKVLEFEPRRGFGFILPHGKTSKADRLFVYWKSIISDIAWPALKIGMEVQFNVVKSKKGINEAKYVTKSDGTKVDYQYAGEVRNVAKDVACDRGKIKIYDAHKAWGRIEPDSEISFQGKRASKDRPLYFAREDVNCPDVDIKIGAIVQFDVYTDWKGLGACNVKIVDPELRGGDACTTPIERTAAGPKAPDTYPRKSNANSVPRTKSVRNNNFRQLRTPDQRRPRSNRSGNRRYSSPMQNGHGPYNTPYMNQRTPAGPHAGPVTNAHFRDWNYRDENSVEVGLHIQQKYIGDIIGERFDGGSKSGSRVQFGRKGSPVHFYLSSMHGTLGAGGAARRILSFMGSKDAVIDACVAVSNKVRNLSKGDKASLTFLIPDEYCGMFIGRKGGYVKQLEVKGVNVTISDTPIVLPGAKLVSWALVRGDPKAMDKAIPMIVEKLGQISVLIREEAMVSQMRGPPERRPYPGPAFHNQQRHALTPQRRNW